MTRAELRQAKRTDKSLLRYRQQKIGLNPKKIIQNWICDVLVFVMVLGLGRGLALGLGLGLGLGLVFGLVLGLSL